MKRLLASGTPLLLILFCAFGFVFAPNDPFHVDMANRFLSPCRQYPFGTDQMGRCILSRLLEGGKTTIGIVLLGSAVVFALGMLLGVPAGRIRSGRILVESVLNAVTALPPIAYLIVFIGAWGNGVFTMIFAVTISLLLRLIKLVKAETEIELTKAYALCAVASGASSFRLLFFYVAPNVVKDAVHYICLSCADMIVIITGFSFIGLGLGDNVIDWGMMVSDARSFVLMRPEIMLYPAVTIFLCAFSFNVLARRIQEGEKDHA
ncbi:MAG: ABC transporter permease [Peptococcaceae bacterium]|nr:ABC transporter permease [Peptococcaceae bacterium]